MGFALPLYIPFSYFCPFFSRTFIVDCAERGKERGSCTFSPINTFFIYVLFFFFAFKPVLLLFSLCKDIQTEPKKKKIMKDNREDSHDSCSFCCRCYIFGYVTGRDLLLLRVRNRLLPRRRLSSFFVCLLLLLLFLDMIKAACFICGATFCDDHYFCCDASPLLLSLLY